MGEFSYIRRIVRMNKEKELEYIKAYVKVERRRCNITPTSGRKAELSCIGFGEMFHLVDRQLVCTTNGTGCWEELDKEEIRKEAVKYIKKVRDYRRRKENLRVA